jgi:hypothetical protein
MATVTSGARCPDCKREIELWPLLKVGEQERLSVLNQVW